MSEINEKYFMWRICFNVILYEGKKINRIDVCCLYWKNYDVSTDISAWWSIYVHQCFINAEIVVGLNWEVNFIQVLNQLLGSWLKLESFQEKNLGG